MNQFKVGDELVFQHRDDGLSVQKILVITPSGIIKTQSYSLKPNLEMRGNCGGTGYFKTRCIGKATPGHKAQIKRNKQIKAIKSYSGLNHLTYEEIDTIYNLLYKVEQ